MRILIEKTPADLFVQGEWVDTYGTHSQRITEAAPVGVRRAIDEVIAWANNTLEPDLRDQQDKYQTIQEIDREIAKFQERRRELEHAQRRA